MARLQPLPPGTTPALKPHFDFFLTTLGFTPNSVALAAAAQPNEVTDAQLERLRRHWSGSQIVEMLGVVAMFGFLNRWNDTMATPLEAMPAAVASTALGDQGWTAGKHAA